MDQLKPKNMKRLFKINWTFILNSRGELDLNANPENDSGSFADAISQGLDDPNPTETQPKEDQDPQDCGHHAA